MLEGVSTGLNKVVSIFGRMFLPKVRDLMIRDFSTLDASAPLMDAILGVMKNGVTSVIITKEGGPVGIITRRDMLSQLFFQKVYAEKTTAGDIMTHPLITIGPDEGVPKAYELMVQKGIRGLVVLEGGKDCRKNKARGYQALGFADAHNRLLQDWILPAGGVSHHNSGRVSSSIMSR